MPTFKNKPRQIEAVELVPGVLMPEGVLVRAVRGGSPDAYEVYNELSDSWIKTKTGDMIRVDKAPRDCSPIYRATFDATYEPADSPTRVLLTISDLHRRAMELCWAIETLPASVWQTALSVEASNVAQRIQTAILSRADGETPGRTAFEAYNDSRGGLTWDGKPIPGWDAVGEDIQTAWRDSAAAVLHSIGV